jgi:23S rRNA (cytidine2498-2'-O)-methyltransferase
VHYILCKENNWAKFLIDEIKENYNVDGIRLQGYPLIKISENIDLNEGHLAFSSTAILNAQEIAEDSVGKQVSKALELILPQIPENIKINCHVFSLTAKYGIIETGRADIVKGKVINGLKKKNIFCIRKGFDRSIPFLQFFILPDRSMVFSYLNEKEMKTYHSLISPFVGGFNNVEDDKKAPSRAYRKIVEAQLVMGKKISEGELLVDLGACPGGWTYIARKNGARVISLDRSLLEDSLMQDDLVTFLKTDAFKYRPEEKIDWAVSDIISTPDRILELIDYWVIGKNCNHFIFTIKFQGDKGYGILEKFKTTASKCDYQIIIKQLNANKNEVTIMGSKIIN